MSKIAMFVALSLVSISLILSLLAIYSRIAILSLSAIYPHIRDSYHKIKNDKRNGIAETAEKTSVNPLYFHDVANNESLIQDFHYYTKKDYLNYLKEQVIAVAKITNIKYKIVSRAHLILGASIFIYLIVLVTSIFT